VTPSSRREHSEPAWQDVASELMAGFPVVTALERIEAWQSDPGAETLDELRHSLAALLAAARTRGARIRMTAPPLPPLAIDIGSLAESPPPADVRSYPLASAGGGIETGELTIDAPADRADVAAHVLRFALDSAWSRAAVRKNAAGFEALNEATRAIAGVLALDDVLQVIVDRVRDLVQARYAALGIVDSSGTIERFITTGMTSDEQASIGPPPRGHGLLGLIIREGRSYRIPDIGAHADSYGFPPYHPPMRSFLGVPVTMKGKPVGNLYLTEKIGSDEFDAQDMRLVEMFALHAGIGIENARLHEQVQRLAIVEERDRIAKDLHDGIIQSIYAVGLTLEDVPELIREDPDAGTATVDRAIDALHGAIRDIRNFISGLRPELLDGADLATGLATLVEEFSRTAAVQTELDVGDAGPDPRPEVRMQLLQVAREALSNVARHAAASRVEVGLRRLDGLLLLTIADNGRGFQPDAPRAESHLGLGNMAARAAALDGSFSIESRPGGGTRVSVEVPLGS